MDYTSDLPHYCSYMVYMHSKIRGDSTAAANMAAAADGETPNNMV